MKINWMFIASCIVMTTRAQTMFRGPNEYLPPLKLIHARALTKTIQTTIFDAKALNAFKRDIPEEGIEQMEDLYDSCLCTDKAGKTICDVALEVFDLETLALLDRIGIMAHNDHPLKPIIHIAIASREWQATDLDIFHQSLPRREKSLSEWVTTCDRNLDTPLHIAARCAHQEAIQKLFWLSNPEAKNTQNKTPLDLLTEQLYPKGCAEISSKAAAAYVLFQKLLRYKTIEQREWSVEDLKNIDRLNDATLLKQDIHGNTLLHIAVKYDDSNAAKIIIARTKSQLRRITNKEHLTPEQIIVRKMHGEVLPKHAQLGEKFLEILQNCFSSTEDT